MKAKRDWQTGDEFEESVVGISKGLSSDAENKMRAPT